MQRIASFAVAALAAILFIAGSAGAQSTPRTVSEGLINLERDEVVLFAFPLNALGATDSCLNVENVNGSSGTCGVPDFPTTELSWPHKAEVTGIRLFVHKAGTAGWDCTFTLQVAGVTAAGSTALVSGAAPALRTVLNQTQPIVVIEEDDLVSVKITNTGTSPAVCNPATPAKVTVQLQGRWIYGTGSASQQN